MIGYSWLSNLPVEIVWKSEGPPMCYRVILQPDDTNALDSGDWKVGEVITTLDIDVWATLHQYRVVQIIHSRFSPYIKQANFLR